MRSKPMIGLNADFRAAKKDAPAFTFVSTGYYDAVSAVGGIPIVLPPLGSETDLKRILDLLDGVVLVGGADLDPRRDGFMLHPSVRTMDTRREDFDRRLMGLIADRRLPVQPVYRQRLTRTGAPGMRAGALPRHWRRR